MNKTTEKIVGKEQLAAICDKLRKAGKTLITCNGSFDLFHYGHLAFLEKAKEAGGVLSVGVNSDSSIKQYKSSDRPVIPQEIRSQILAALELVDYVYIYDETTPMAFLEIVKPDLHANGEEYKEEGIENSTVEKFGGKVFFVERTPGCSTTELIARIKGM